MPDWAHCKSVQEHDAESVFNALKTMDFSTFFNIFQHIFQHFSTATFCENCIFQHFSTFFNRFFNILQRQPSLKNLSFKICQRIFPFLRNATRRKLRVKPFSDATRRLCELVSRAAARPQLFPLARRILPSKPAASSLARFRGDSDAAANAGSRRGAVAA